MARNTAQDSRPNGWQERVVAPLVPRERPVSGEVWPDAPASGAEAGRQGRDPPDRRAGAASDDFAGLQAVDPSLHVSDRVSGFRNDPFVGLRPPIGSRMLRAVIRFCVVFLIGVGATLAWQSEGDKAVEMAKTPVLNWAPNWAPPVWLSSPSATSSIATTKPPAVAQVTRQAEPLPQPPSPAQPPAPVAPAQPPAPVAAATPPEAAQQMQTMARDVTMTRHSLEQLADKQEEIAQTIATLQAAEQDIRQKMAALPKPAPIPRRKPPPPAATSAGLQPSPSPSPPAPSQAVQSSTEPPTPGVPRPPAPLH